MSCASSPSTVTVNRCPELGPVGLVLGQELAEPLGGAGEFREGTLPRRRNRGVLRGHGRCGLLDAHGLAIGHVESEFLGVEARDRLYVSQWTRSAALDASADGGGDPDPARGGLGLDHEEIGINRCSLNAHEVTVGQVTELRDAGVGDRGVDAGPDRDSPVPSLGDQRGLEGRNVAPDQRDQPALDEAQSATSAVGQENSADEQAPAKVELGRLALGAESAGRPPLAVVDPQVQRQASWGR